jgi:hypothetical protein
MKVVHRIDVHPIWHCIDEKKRKAVQRKGRYPPMAKGRIQTKQKTGETMWHEARTEVLFL